MIWRIPALLVILVMLVVGQQWRERVVVQREFSRVTGVYAEQALIADRAARAKKQAMQDTILKAKNESKQREKRLALDAGRAGAELDRLRNAIAAASRAVSDNPASARDYSATSDQLFLACGAELVEVAGAADRHASEAVMLRDAWPK